MAGIAARRRRGMAHPHRPYILDHHAVPYQDLYSFSKPGAPWFAWEWGSDVFCRRAAAPGGLKAVVLFAGVLLAVFATTLIRRMIWRGVHLFVALAVALLSVGASSIHFLARPHIFTLLFLSIAVWMVEYDREKQSRPHLVAGSSDGAMDQSARGVPGADRPAGSVRVGHGDRSLIAEKEAWGGLWWRNAVRYGVLAAACAAASLVNPYGYHLHQHMVEYLRSDWIRSVIQEFMSPSFRNENMMQFEGLLLIGSDRGGGAAAPQARGRSAVDRFLRAHGSSSARHVPVYVTVVGPVIAYEIASWWKAWTRDAAKKSLPAILNQMAADSASGFRRTSIWPLAVVVGLALTGAPIPWPKDFPDIDFPTEDRPRPCGRDPLLSCPYYRPVGDYLIYVNPQQKVFVDGRSDFYGPETGNQYLAPGQRRSRLARHPQ